MAIENVNTALEIAFLIAICCQSGIEKPLFLAIYDQSPSIIKSVFDCRLSGVVKMHSMSYMSLILILHLEGGKEMRYTYMYIDNR